jgi:hypothetical protein
MHTADRTIMNGSWLRIRLRDGYFLVVCLSDCIDARDWLADLYIADIHESLFYLGKGVHLLSLIPSCTERLLLIHAGYHGIGKLSL